MGKYFGTDGFRGEANVTLTAEKIAELAPRFENNKSFNKCLGKADRALAESLLTKLFGA